MGWAYFVLPEPLLSKLVELTSHVPRAARLDQHGRKYNPDTAHPFHSTFLLSLPGDSSVSRQKAVVAQLTQALAHTEPIEVQISAERGIVVGRVERIKSHAVYAASLELFSPRYRQTREQMAQVIGHGAKVAYESHGHVTVCYVDGAHEQLLRDVMETHGAILFPAEQPPHTAIATSLVVEYGQKRYHVPIGSALAGGASSSSS